jgi:hypothetical protein
LRHFSEVQDGNGFITDEQFIAAVIDLPKLNLTRDDAEQIIAGEKRL